MSLQNSVTCDKCGSDLTYRKDDPMPQYSLVLEPRSVPGRPNLSGMTYSYAIHVEAPIPGRKDFCDFDCLRLWIELNRR